MVRISKKQEHKAISPRKRHYVRIKKTGSKKDNLPKGFKEHDNAVEANSSKGMFIAKIK